MALFDIFTGDPAQQAAEQQRQFLGQLIGQVGPTYYNAQQGGLSALGTGQQQAVGALGTGYGQGRADITASLDPAVAALLSGQTAGAGALTGAQGDALAALQSGVSGAVGAYQPLTGLANQFGAFYQPAQTQYNAALGLGPPGAQAAATDAFRNTPGYQFALNQGLESIIRNANVGGGAAGGNVLRESQTYGSGLADQTFQNYLANLFKVPSLYAPLATTATGQAVQGVGNALLTGGTGAANIYAGTGQRLADLYGTTGANLANVYGTTGGRLADLASRGGAAQAGVYQGTGTNIADLLTRIASGQTGAYGQLAGPYAGTYATGAAGEAQGSANIWNALLGGAKLAAGSGGLAGLIGR